MSLLFSENGDLSEICKVGKSNPGQRDLRIIIPELDHKIIELERKAISLKHLFEQVSEISGQNFNYEEHAFIQ
jgi:hypothetical protein